MIGLLIAVIYLAFISLGLPDSLLGSAWPTMHAYFNVPESFAGYISMSIALMTVVSALIAPSLIKRFRTEWIVAISILLTIVGLLGFSFSKYYWMLFIFVVPYGLGAGSVDAALNHYVANHYSSRVMNFLHCFYGLGAIISPLIMGLALKHAHWNEGYQWVSYIQIGILALFVLSFPLWRKNKKEEQEEKIPSKSIKDALKLPAVILTLIAFFSYCAGEATCFIWTSSYFEARYTSLDEGIVAAFGSIIFGGLMLGRLISGFISNKIKDKNLIRIGILIELLGILLIFLPIDNFVLTAIGFLFTGIGMGPIYPSIQHMALINFGAEYSAPVIGLQMASAYIGTMFMPMVFGHLFQNIGYFVLPIYLIIFLILNIGLLEISYKINNKKINDNTSKVL